MSARTAVSAHINAANTLTPMGALMGLAAVALSLHGYASAALTCLIGAILCDRLDGIVARRLGQSSEFGVQLDSLADAVSFVVAPAVIVFGLAKGTPMTLVLSLYVLAGLWRLAHFNVHGMDTDNTFRGVPTTIAGSGFVLLWAGLRLSPVAEHTPYILGGFLTVIAPLMLSSLPICKRGWLTRALQVLALPTLIAAWWV